MEWLDGAERLNSQNVTIDHAITLVRGLSKIHDAGVLHFDVFERNILVIPGSKRAVWIDFSCAQTEHVMEASLGKETYIGGALPMYYVLASCTSSLTQALSTGDRKNEIEVVSKINIFVCEYFPAYVRYSLRCMDSV